MGVCLLALCYVILLFHHSILIVLLLPLLTLPMLEGSHPVLSVKSIMLQVIQLIPILIGFYCAATNTSRICHLQSS